MRVFVLLLAVSFIATAEYCAGQTPGNQQAEDSNLGPVKLEGIDNKLGCPGGTGVQWFKDEKAELSAGSEYTLQFDVSTCGNAYTRKNAAWIDFNGNEKFDEWEKIGEQDVGATPGNNMLSFKFKVPSTTTFKASDAQHVVITKIPTRMRVMVVENGFDPMDPCLQFPYGGVKDFPILVGHYGGLDVGGIILIAVFVAAFVGTVITVMIMWKVKGVPPKDFSVDYVVPKCTNFCGLVKAGVMFVAFKCKCSKGGATNDYEEL